MTQPGHSVHVTSIDSFGARSPLPGQGGAYFRIEALAETWPEVRRLPVSLCILLENLLRHEDGQLVSREHVAAVAQRAGHWGSDHEVLFFPSRVVMQDYSGLVALIDVATLRDRIAGAGGDPAAIRPVKPVDLIIDHSLIVEHAGDAGAYERNLASEYAQNAERFSFLKWAQAALDNVRIVPPGNGIIHQINLEHLAQIVARDDQTGVIFPESQIGTDSHTTMINGLGVLAWGVGGIEAEAALLGEPVSMLIPDVVGVRLTGALRAGVTATDLALTLTEQLRKLGVVGKFVEFFGPGVAGLTVADRATVANMAPEYGATCGLFPLDAAVSDYLLLTGRSPAAVARLESYARANGLWEDGRPRDYAQVIGLDLSQVVRSGAGPRNPHQRFDLAQVARGAPTAGALKDGDVVIAAITSCTNTSNPHNMVAAGLLARNARARGLRVDDRIKTTLSPGSRAVTGYLEAAGLLAPLAELGFDLVGFGCATCVGNSGPLPVAVDHAIAEGNLNVAAVLSGNRNFEGRIHPGVRSNYLMSPPMVVAHALAGTVALNIESDPLGVDASGAPVLLHQIWPDEAEIAGVIARHVTPDLYNRLRGGLNDGGARWQALDAAGGIRFPWSASSSYVSPSPFFQAVHPGEFSLRAAAPLLVLGDNVTTDHISPVGAIEAGGPAEAMLLALGVAPQDFNAYGARRGNAEVMRRGTFANVRLRNRLADGREGGFTRHSPTGDLLPVSEAASRYLAEGRDMVVLAGANYGAGSARDWAAKGTAILGVKAVIAGSFERIHRANLVLMGVMPLDYGDLALPAGLEADSRIELTFDGPLRPRMPAVAHITSGGQVHSLAVRVRIDTGLELDYFRAGGILPFLFARNSARLDQETRHDP